MRSSVIAILLLSGSLVPALSAQRLSSADKQEGRVISRSVSRRSEHVRSERSEDLPNARTARTSRPERATSDPHRDTGRMFAIFVGISEYPDPDDNLDYTADDARRLHQAMVRGAGMRAADGVVLVDRAATVANVQRAFADVARQAGPDDTFVFFFSGHGDRVRRTGQQASDPDGYDETLDFYDGDITDDGLRGWFDTIHAGISLVVLDSCFSGGFSKDVISSPGRMGLFSSEEDVTSGVADEFRAGGYLAKFIAEGVGDRRADDDRDGSITAIELSQYLHERYRRDVKSAARRDDHFVHAGGSQTHYQHLVVDRGGIGPYDKLFSVN